MISIIVLCIITSLLFLLSGTLFGAALESGQTAEWKNRYAKFRTKCDELSNQSYESKKAYRDLLADYKYLLDNFNNSQDTCESLKKTLAELRGQLSRQGQVLLDSTSIKLKPLQNQIKLRGPIKATLSDKISTKNPFEIILETLVKNRHDNCAILSDQSGLIIASTCDYPDELAAISTLFEYCEKVINRNKYFHTLTGLTFTLNKDISIIILPIKIDDLTIYYAGMNLTGTINIEQKTTIATNNASSAH